MNQVLMFAAPAIMMGTLLSVVGFWLIRRERQEAERKRHQSERRL